MSAGRKQCKPPRAGPKKKAAGRPEKRSMGRAKKPGKKVSDWALRQYFDRGKPVEYLEQEIGVTRSGLSKVLRRKGGFLFTTFLRTCFLQTSGEAVLVIAAEGCKMELRWVIEQGNARFVSECGNRR